jgi:hypothetical protein
MASSLKVGMSCLKHQFTSLMDFVLKVEGFLRGKYLHFQT